MNKRKLILYWVATVWLSLGMMSTGVVQLLHTEAETKMMTDLGYPVYLLTLLGIWKVLGVLAVLMPRLALLKEWAYAGFFFAMSGAVVSHIAHADPARTLFGPLLLIILTMISWYFRPADRRLVPVI